MKNRNDAAIALTQPAISRATDLVPLISYLSVQLKLNLQLPDLNVQGIIRWSQEYPWRSHERKEEVNKITSALETAVDRKLKNPVIDSLKAIALSWFEDYVHGRIGSHQQKPTGRIMLQRVTIEELDNMRVKLLPATIGEKKLYKEYAGKADFSQRYTMHELNEDSFPSLLISPILKIMDQPEVKLMVEEIKILKPEKAGRGHGHLVIKVLGQWYSVCQWE